MAHLQYGNQHQVDPRQLKVSEYWCKTENSKGLRDD